MNNAPIGIFDSGIGGISVLTECRKTMPNENFIYLADFANAPYGNKSAEEILALSAACVNKLLSRGVKAIVAACNTATSVAANKLRTTLNVPLIGLEPALKPACEQCLSKEIILLCTVATSKQDKFQNLLKTCGNARLIVLPQKDLAENIEKNFSDHGEMRRAVKEIFAGKTNAGGVVLGCTHYVFLKPFIAEFFAENGNSNVKIFDGNGGAARRLMSVLAEKNALSDRSERGSVEFI